MANVRLPTLAALLGADEAELRLLSKQKIMPPIERGAMARDEAIQKYIAHLRDPRVTINTAGALIEKSGPWISRLLAQGYIKRTADGVLTAAAVFKGYIAFLSDEQRRASKTRSESKLRDARSREVELRIAERERRLIDVGDMDEVVDRYAGMIRERLAGLPARVTRDLVLRRDIEKATNEILTSVAADLRQARDDLRSAGEADRAEPRADA